MPCPRAIAWLAVVMLCVAQLNSSVRAERSSVTSIPDLTDNRTEWARTIERVANGVVSIQIDSVRAFDTENNASAQATGFVVDAKRGLILTNRHVVTPGPVTAQAVFVNREEVTLYPVYRDPVHDFGIYRYDPAQLKFIVPEQIPLAPTEAKVGTEIRVIGNDAGEQLSILAGTLARLDRDAPQYGVGKYNDFNTFYYQAASGTSGGSSGSPVIDVKGRAIALNAGGAAKAASSFYFPLDRVVRALSLIEAGKPVTRGTLSVLFAYTPFDELRRLGLGTEIERVVRHSQPHPVGLLVAREVQPGSASEGLIEPGDILVRINNRLITDFLTLETILDDAVSQSVSVEVLRGGKALSLAVPVTDLHAITPASYIEFGAAVVHALSYQEARHFNVPIRGMFVANPGHVLASAGVPRGAVLTSVNGKPTATLDDFEGALGTLADGERATMRFITLDEPRRVQTRVMRMDRRWYPVQRCQRDDVLGSWPCQPLADGPSPVALEAASTTYSSTGDARADALAPSLVGIDFKMPYSVSGVAQTSYQGTGIVIDAVRGLLVADRNTVPVALGDVRLIFGGVIEIPGRVEYIHPLHNLAVVSYDPALLGTTPVKAVTFSTQELKPGEDVWVVGLRSDLQVTSQQSKVSGYQVTQLPARTFAFRDAALETVMLVDGPSNFDGVVIDRSGAVRALWSSFAYDSGSDLQQENLGIPSDLVMEMAAAVRTSIPLRSLEIEAQVVSLSVGRGLGLSDAWVKKLVAHSPAHRQVLAVDRLIVGSPAAQHLQPGDLLLSINGQPVTRLRELELASQVPRASITVWRNGAEQTVVVPTVVPDSSGIGRVVFWAGATLEAPYRALSAQRGIGPEGVFVSHYLYGSPATRYGLWAGHRIVAVDDQPTPDLDAFLAAVHGRANRASLRLKTLGWNDAVEVITLKLDTTYWPTYELTRTAAGWQRRSIE